MFLFVCLGFVCLIAGKILIKHEHAHVLAKFSCSIQHFGKTEIRENISFLYNVLKMSGCKHVWFEVNFKASMGKF